MLRLWTAVQGWFTRDEQGATMVEYALLVALIAIVAIAAIILLGNRLSSEFSDISQSL